MQNSNINFFILLFISFIYVPLSIVSGLALAPLLVILGVFSFSNGRFSFIKKLLKTNYNTYLVGLFFFAVLTSFSSSNVEYSFVSLVKILGVFLCGFAALYNKQYLREEYKKIFAIVFIAGYSLGIILISVELFSDGIFTKALRYLINQEEYTGYRPESLNRGACVLAISFWLFSAAINYLQINKKLYLTMGCWMVVMSIMMLQESSSAKLSFVVSSVVYASFLILKCKFMKLYLILFLLFILLFPIVFLAVPAKIIYNDYPSIPDSMVHRMVIWNFSMQRMYDKPYTGWGINAARYIPGASDQVPSIIDEERTWKRIPNHSHNIMIQIGVELGLVGILFFMAYISTFMHSIRLNEKDILKKTTAITVITSYLIIGFFAFSVWQEWWLSTAFLIAVMYSFVFGDAEMSTEVTDIVDESTSKDKNGDIEESKDSLKGNKGKGSGRKENDKVSSGKGKDRNVKNKG